MYTNSDLMMIVTQEGIDCMTHNHQAVLNGQLQQTYNSTSAQA